MWWWCRDEVVLLDFVKFWLLICCSQQLPDTAFLETTTLFKLYAFVEWTKFRFIHICAWLGLHLQLPNTCWKRSWSMARESICKDYVLSCFVSKEAYFVTPWNNSCQKIVESSLFCKCSHFLSFWMNFIRAVCLIQSVIFIRKFRVQPCADQLEEGSQSQIFWVSL